MSCFSS